jgi:hypothetical protein
MATLVKCVRADCTSATTGICLLSHPKLTDCPEFKASGKTQDVVEVIAEPEPVSNEPEVVANRTFHSGLELGTDDAALLMREKYTHLVGILGSWNAGKTCFLSSLYLMVANGSLLPRYTFSSSRTLQGFEDRARLTRTWEGSGLPEKLADHTILADPRRPSLLHLGLKVEGKPDELNLLFTDLPGEWSKNLVDRGSNASSFKFLNRAEAVLIVVDCPGLASDKRFSEIQRAKQLIERLAVDVNLDRSIPIILVLAKADMNDMAEPALVKDLIAHGQSFKFQMDVILTAAFSSKPAKIENGEGVIKCLEKILEYSLTPSPNLAISREILGPRMFEQFRC